MHYMILPCALVFLLLGIGQCSGRMFWICSWHARNWLCWLCHHMTIWDGAALLIEQCIAYPDLHWVPDYIIAWDQYAVSVRKQTTRQLCKLLWQIMYSKCSSISWGGSYPWWSNCSQHAGTSWAFLQLSEPHRHLTAVTVGRASVSLHWITATTRRHFLWHAYGWQLALTDRLTDRGGLLARSLHAPTMLLPRSPMLQPTAYSNYQLSADPWRSQAVPIMLVPLSSYEQIDKATSSAIQQQA